MKCQQKILQIKKIDQKLYHCGKTMSLGVLKHMA